MKTLIQICKTTLIIALMVTSVALFAQTERETVFFEDFESGWGSWWADNGVWEIGVPTSGPDSSYAGQNCAASILNGNYPTGANSRLISPYIVLPSDLQTNEKIALRFWHWFSFSTHSFGFDKGIIQISADNNEWVTISSSFHGVSSNWSPVWLDLTAYAGSTIRIGIRIIDESTWSGTSTGWYIDDISIEVGQYPINNPENWESGIGDWWVENGVWEVGEPIDGPDIAYSQPFCAATLLEGHYPAGADSRLISPCYVLPDNLQPNEKIALKFWHWFRFSTHSFGFDKGTVQISIDNGDWETISEAFQGTSAVWTPVWIDLTAYAGSSIRLAFRIIDESTWSGTNAGWFVDNISIEVNQYLFNTPENWESGFGNWWVSNGVWEIGEPTFGPDSAFSPPYCAATVLEGHYPVGSNSKLVSPYVTLTSEEGVTPSLYFWHWFSFATHSFGNDKGRVLISVNDGDWQAISTDYIGNSIIWSQVFINLADYTDSTVRVSFQIVDETTWSGTSSGWFVDNIRIDGIIINDIDEPQFFSHAKFHLYQNYPNPFNPSTTIPYKLDVSCYIEISVYNILGKKIQTLFKGLQTIGEHQVRWNGQDELGSEMQSGIYFYELLINNDLSARKKMLITR